MGILNTTPDSFYDGDKYSKIDKAIEHAVKMFKDGADIIDIGGESSRPGSKNIGISEELERTIPVIERVVKDIEIQVSIDTSKSEVALEAVKAGATMINDISGCTFDPKILSVAADYGCELIINHIKGNPFDMQKNTEYNEIIQDVLDFFMKSIDNALRNGVRKDKIIIDPGIGFGKSPEQNFILLKYLAKFKETDYPVAVGISRKSFIGSIYVDDEDRLPATIALNAIAVNNGADIIRVHDVKEHRLAIDSIDFLLRTKLN
jgi:dihydropteroate synthase